MPRMVSTPNLSYEEVAELFELRMKGVTWDSLKVLFKMDTRQMKRLMIGAANYGRLLWVKDVYWLSTKEVGRQITRQYNQLDLP